MLAIVDGIIAGSGVRTIIVTAAPGSGKSLIPVIAGKLIPAGLADKICWVAPRKTLQEQGERGFLDQKFRDMLGHNLMIRSATNDNNPCRATNGFTTTYQAVAADDKHLAREFRNKRYILVLDEFHHCGVGGAWEKALQPLVEQASFLVLMTGTLARGDENPIAFIPYRAHGETMEPDLTSDPSTRIVPYTRADALSERAILPLNFILHDGDVQWAKNGLTHDGKLSTTMIDSGAAIWTAISTEFATELLHAGITHWASRRNTNPRSKLLVVTADVSQAKKVKGELSAMGYRSEIATSHDDKGARGAIRRFKGRGCDILVSVAMVYEGFDCPEATHLVCLTHIRSVPWIEQMVARVVRIDPQAGPYEAQVGYVFAPDDFQMKKVILQIQAEQVACAKTFCDAKDVQAGEIGKSGADGFTPFGITPLGSRLTEQREINLGDAFKFKAYEMPDMPKTQSEIETELREAVEKHIRKYSFENRYAPQRINAEIKNAFLGKSRKEMAVPELKNLLAYVRHSYPIGKHAQGPPIGTVPSPRRGGAQRVPTKALRWEQMSLF